MEVASMATAKTRKSATMSNSSPKAGAKAKSAASGDWRGEALARMRALILEADPEMIEE
jgi:hypothetical protein